LITSVVEIIKQLERRIINPKIKKQRDINSPDPNYVCIYELHLGEHPSRWKVINRCKPEDCPWLRTKEEYQNVNIHFVGD
jgi:hypothetical protein